MTLREKMIAKLTEIYFARTRKGTMAEDMADAILELLEQAK